jgi:lipid-A-disaccharide synthase
MRTRPTVCLLAADVSGDRLAADLARALRCRAPEARLLGAGGAAMADAGVDVRVRLTDLSFTGVLDALYVLGELLERFCRVQRMVLDARPDLVVLVDAEVVSLPFATWLRRRGIPAVFYFPPQTWLWGRWRMPLIVPLVKRVLSAFPAEAELYRRAGADTVWTGHPLRDIVRAVPDADRALVRIGLDPERPLVALMPGSRRNEIRRLSPAILGAAERLQALDQRLQFVLPLASEALRAAVEAEVARRRLRDLVVYRPESYAVLSRARVVIQSSGTATLETALLGIPSVITYRLRPIEYVFARLFMCVDYIGMANILLGDMVQPELFQKHVDAEHLAAAAWSLLTDEVRRRWVTNRLAEIRALLGPPGVADRAAAAVVGLLPQAAGAVLAETPTAAVLDVAPSHDAVRA